MSSETNMDVRSAKRRRVSMTRNVSISPVKITVDSGPIATRASPSPSQARSSDSPLTRASVAQAPSDLLPSPCRSSGIDGAEDEIFDMKYIGKEKRRISKKPNPTPLRNITSNRRSPSSLSGAGSGPTGESSIERRAKDKRVSFASAGETGRVEPVVEQENLLDDRAHSARTRNGPPIDVDTAMQDAGTTIQADSSVMVDDLASDEPELPKLPTPDVPYGPTGLMSSSPSGQAARRLTTRRSMLPPAKRRDNAITTKTRDATVAATPLAHEHSSVEPESHSPVEIAEEPGVNDDADVAEHDESSGSPRISSQPKGPIKIYDVGSDEKRDELEALLRDRRRLSEQVDFLEELCRNDAQQLRRSDAARLLDIVLGDQVQMPLTQTRAVESISQQVARLMPFISRQIPIAIQQASPMDRASARPHLISDIEGAFTPLALNVEREAVFRKGKHIERLLVRAKSPGRLIVFGLFVEIDPSTGHVTKTGYDDKNSQNLILPELSHFIVEYLHIASESGRNDLSTIGRATAVFWRLASLRARTWERCVQDHQDLVADVDPLDEDDSTRKRGAVGVHLGRQSLRLEANGIGFLVTWKIDFDWTGEAESHVFACAAFPASWRRREDAQAFDNVGELFDLFLRKFGVQQAVKHMVDLMFGKND